MSQVKLKVVVSTYNAMPYLARCLRSIAQQRASFDVVVVDDASTQPGQKEWIAHVCKKEGWRPLFRQQQLGPLASRVAGIAAHDPKPDDVIVLIDGDDWLIGDRVFEKIGAVYERGGVDLTYGQHIEYPRGHVGGRGDQRGSRPCSKRVIEQGSYRQQPFDWFHPWTFRYRLWAAIHDIDLRGADGEYVTTATDSAFLFPLLELSGQRKHCFSNDILYVHNRDNPINESKVVGSAQGMMELFFRSKTPYLPLRDSK